MNAVLMLQKAMKTSLAQDRLAFFDDVGLLPDILPCLKLPFFLVFEAAVDLVTPLGLEPLD